MHYKFDKETLQFTRTDIVRKKDIIIAGLLSIFIILPLILSLSTTEKTSIVEKLSIEEKMIIIKDHNKFSEDKLVEYIQQLNFRFPHIILAQSKLESNYYKSGIFVENHNLFGMKEARIRANISQGTNRGHAYYNDWKESVMDYALYYSTYLYQLKTEDQYFDYLKQYYAEDPNYVPKLKSLIKKEQLQLKFK